MIVITSAAPSTATSSVPSSIFRTGKAEVNLGDLTILLQEIFQKMRNILQEQSVSQSINSFELAKTSIAKKRQSADKNYEANFKNSMVSMGAGILGGFIGTGTTIISARINSKANKIALADKAASTIDIRKCEQLVSKLNQNAANWSALGAGLAPASTQLMTAVGNASTQSISKDGSIKQIEADYIKESQNTYDKQREYDVNNMRVFSQKITDVTRTLTDLHGATLSALNWK